MGRGKNREDDHGEGKTRKIQKKKKKKKKTAPSSAITDPTGPLSPTKRD